MDRSQLTSTTDGGEGVNKKLTNCLKMPFFLYKMVDKGGGGGGVKMAQNRLTSTVNGQ